MLMTLYAASIDFTRATNDTLPGSESSFAEWLSRIAGAIMVIAVLMLLIYLLWGGISWITAGGDSSKVQSARDRITQAVLGIIVLAASIAIFMLVQSFLGVEILTFTGGTSSGSNTTAPPAPRNRLNVR
jgi:hypothetical protein